MKTLVINPFGIGDVLFSFKLIESLKQQNSSVGFLSNERTHPLVRLNRSIDHVFVFDRDSLRALLKSNPIKFLSKIKELLTEIKSQGYDACIDLSMGREYAFLMMMAGIKSRTGLNYKNRSRFLKTKINITGFEDRHVSDYHMLCSPKELQHVDREIQLPLHANATEEFVNRYCHQKGLKDKNWIAIAPGGGVTWGNNATYKQWSSDKFAQLIQRITSDESLEVVLVGSEIERALLNEVANKSSLPSNRLVYDMNMEQIICFLSKAKSFVGNDGGLFHLAHWTGIPVIGLFGPVSAQVYGAGWASGPYQNITAQVPCRPCYKNFRFPGCDYDRQCLEVISVEEVFEALQM